MDLARFVFLDETGTATDLRGAMDAAVRRGAWSRPCRMATGAPRPSSAGLRQTGIEAPLVLDGPMNGRAFRAYVEQCLAPALAPGNVVVLDNLAAHKIDGGRQAIATAGASM